MFASLTSTCGPMCIRHVMKRGPLTVCRAMLCSRNDLECVLCFNTPLMWTSCAITGDFWASFLGDIFKARVCSVIAMFVGTRYKRRGVDEDGNAANYVETEQVASRLSFCLILLSVVTVTNA